jgi:5'-phosphate synthase pdxT subunit
VIVAGVLALQGAVEAHLNALHRCGAGAVRVRTAEQLESVDCLVIPGGESTTMGALLDHNELRAPLARRLAEGLPVLGTCAGMILLSTEILDGRTDQVPLGAIDLSVRRNAFGRQLASFETDLDVDGIADPPLHGVFIRAPWIERVGESVDVLSRVDGHPVCASSGSVLVTSFHPELTDDTRVHQLMLERVPGGRAQAVGTS